MLREDVQPVAANRWSGSVGGANSSQENDATYVLARLKRDRPDLADQAVVVRAACDGAGAGAGRSGEAEERSLVAARTVGWRPLEAWQRENFRKCER